MQFDTLRTKLSNLALIIIDEVSMVGANMLLEVHKRLQQVKGVSPDATFGGVSILAVGGLSYSTWSTEKYSVWLNWFALF